MPAQANSPPHKRHRKRISALRLSSDTTTTLPAYIPVQSALEDSDRPPDYPDSAEEADSEDSGNIDPYPHSPRKSLSRRSSTATPPPTSSSTRRVFSAQSYKRKKPSRNDATDPYLDALLARSVHALEMSNTLLQSTMATQTSLSEAGAAADNFTPSTAGGSTNTLSLRLTGGEVMRKDKQSRWPDEIVELSRDVDNLFERTTNSSLVSSSLPTPSHLSRHRRLPPSLDLRHEPQLTLSEHERSKLVAPPPRALTQYVASASTPYLPGTSQDPHTTDDEVIFLPSTLGLRASSSVSHLPLSPPQPPAGGSLQLSNNLKLHSALSSPRVTNKHPEPSTPAYKMLASFVARPSPQPPPLGGPSSSSSILSSSPFAPSKFLSRSGSRSSLCSVPRGTTKKDSGDIITTRTDGTSTPDRPSRSSTPKLSFSPSSNPSSTIPTAPSSAFSQRRPMTPPVEESSLSSSSSDGEGRPKAKLTVQSLRKILDEQPPLSTSTSNPSASTTTVAKLRPPAFQPRTPARTLSSAGTSTTTASVSRLFTRNRHLLTAGGPPTPRTTPVHSPTGSISFPGGGSSSSVMIGNGGGNGNDNGNSNGEGSPRPSTVVGVQVTMLSTSPPRRGALKGSRANSNANTPTAGGSVPASPALTPSTSTSTGASSSVLYPGAGAANMTSASTHTSVSAATLAAAAPGITKSSSGGSLAAWAFLTKGALGGGGSGGSRTPTTSGSGWSTPKRISFAELPEAYNSGVEEEEEEEEDENGTMTIGKGKGKLTSKPSIPKRQPGESSERFRELRQGRRQRQRREQRMRRANGTNASDGSASSSEGAGLRWWNWILGPPVSASSGGRRYEDKIEDRLTRGGLGLGGPGGGSVFSGGYGGGGEWGI